MLTAARYHRFIACIFIDRTRFPLPPSLPTSSIGNDLALADDLFALIQRQNPLTASSITDHLAHRSTRQPSHHVHPRRNPLADIVFLLAVIRFLHTIETALPSVEFDIPHCDDPQTLGQTPLLACITHVFVDGLRPRTC